MDDSSASFPGHLGLRTCQLRLSGVTDHQRRGPTWQQLSHGLHVPYGTCASLPTHAAALRSVLSDDAAYGHVTGAALRGWPLPLLPPDVPLLASTMTSTHVQRAGAYVRRRGCFEAEIVGGVPVLDPLAILLDCAEDLGLIDLVALTDAACRLERLDPVGVAAALPARARGSRRLRRALALCEPRSESWWESVLRLVHVLSGIACVQAQSPVEDAGRAVAYADLRLTGTVRLVEYDGEDHRRKPQHHADLRREKMLSRLGLERFGYVEPEISRTPGRIVRDAEIALGLPHRPSRVRGWWRHAYESTVTARGRLRLEERMDRYRRASVRNDRPRRE